MLSRLLALVKPRSMPRYAIPRLMIASAAITAGLTLLGRVAGEMTEHVDVLADLISKRHKELGELADRIHQVGDGPVAQEPYPTPLDVDPLHRGDPPPDIDWYQPSGDTGHDG